MVGRIFKELYMREFRPSGHADSSAGEALTAKRRKEFIEALRRKEKEAQKANERTLELRRKRLAQS
jgi:hypothetical protein